MTRGALGLLFLVGGTAGADEVICEDPGVRVQGQVSDRWATSIGQACHAVQDLADRDREARVKIMAATSEVLVVEVALRDGRTAVRRLKDPETLTPTLEALLTLPPTPVAAALTSAAPIATPAPDTKTVAITTPIPTPEAPSFSAGFVGFEAGAGVSARAAGTNTYLSMAPTIFAELRLGNWLVGIDARWELLEFRPESHHDRIDMDTIGLGINVAHRFDLDFMELDTGFAPRLVIEFQSDDSNPDIDVSASTPDLRLGMVFRGIFGKGAFRPFVAFDAEFSPTRLRHSRRLLDGFPILPAYSTGLAAGLMWGAE
ncbi:MAG: hypothetical protein U1E65_31380 [Myxococcota bacterium]